MIPLPARYACCLMLAVCCSVAAPLRSQGAGGEPQTLSSTQSELLLRQKKIKRLEMGMESQQQLIHSSARRETRLLDELAIIETNLKNERTRLHDMQQRLAEQERLLTEKRQVLNELIIAKALARQHVKKRLAAYYRMGQTGLLNAIFSSSGLAELLRFDTYYEAMVQHDNETLQQYKEKILKIIDTTKAIEKQKETLVALIAEVAGQEQKLNAVRQERKILLAKVRTEKELYKAALEEIRDAAEKLTATIARLKKEALQDRQRQREAIEEKTQRIEKKKALANLRFAEQKGKLPPPLTGTVTKMFGKSATEKFGLTLQTNGITIASKPGTAIRAVYYGTVVYVGELKGYGNLLVIDHDQQYYSLIARAEQYFKKKGDTVMTGEVIGISGEPTGLLEDGLHFEIRHGTKPLNPMDWLKPGSLVMAGKK